MNPPVVEVRVADRRWSAIRGARKIAAASALAAFEAAGVTLAPGAEASVLLTDDAEVAALNAAWRGKPGATNVLSFPAAAPARLARSPLIGDIALAYETCAREAEAEGKNLKAHLSHLVVHGALHLLGHDHETIAEAERMEALERAILTSLGVADPYADAAPEPQP